MHKNLVTIALLAVSLQAFADDGSSILRQSASIEDSQLNLSVFEFASAATSTKPVLKIANLSRKTIQVSGDFGSPILAPGSSGVLPCRLGYLSLSVQSVVADKVGTATYLSPSCGTELVILENRALTDAEVNNNLGDEQ